MFLPDWSYDGSDPGLRLFTLANAKLPSIAKAANRAPEVYEIGCADTDFIKRASEAGAVVWGIDWRKTGYTRGDILSAHLPDADVFVSLSAVEHIGLGHYENDPVDPHGDIKTVQRVREYLNPGGFFYFDVPYAPEGYWVKGSKCRIYDDQSLKERFGPHEVLGYTTGAVDGWIDKPTTNATGSRPYYYVALLVRKDAANS